MIRGEHFSLFGPITLWFLPVISIVKFLERCNVNTFWYSVKLDMMHVEMVNFGMISLGQCQDLFSLAVWNKTKCQISIVIVITIYRRQTGHS